MQAHVDNFNANNFPYKIKFKNGRLVLSKYILNDIIEDINLEDCEQHVIVEIEGETERDMLNTLSKIKFKNEYYKKYTKK